MSYNKKVKNKRFAVDNLILKLILPTEQVKGKLSPLWEGPFKVEKIFDGNVYELRDIRNNRHIGHING
ncbi:hypothetical protein AHAS_Ahas01G0262800 [Arachis hypogaea]